MGAVWTIARNELALRIRDKSIFILGIIAPLGLAFIFNQIFGGGINDVGENITLDVGIVVEDQGQIGAAFRSVVDAIENEGLLAVTEYPSEDAVRSAIDDGEVSAAYVVPATLTQEIMSGENGTITVIGDIDAATTTQIVTSIAEGFASGQRTVNLAVQTAVGSGAIGLQDVGTAIDEAIVSTEEPIISLGDIDAATRQLDGSTYFVASLSIFFIFFIGGISITSLLQERQQGTLARLLGSPIRPSSIAVGKSLASVVIALAAMTVLVIASRFLMGASWGAPLGVILLMVTAVLAVVSIMMMVGGLAKTPEQAGNLQAVVAVTLAMLGGTFVPVTGDGLLARLSFVTPNAWFMRGLGELAGGGVTAALPAVGVLAAMTLVFGGIGMAVMQKVVRL